MEENQHPLSLPTARHSRKQMLFQAWLALGPIQVVFDSRGEGVVMRNSERDSHECRLTLVKVQEMAAESFTAVITYEGQSEPDTVTIPFSAVAALVSIPCQETHFWAQDHQIAEARAHMYRAQPNRQAN